MKVALLTSFGLLGAFALTSCDTPGGLDASNGAVVAGFTGERHDAITGEPIGTAPNYLIGVLAHNRRRYADGYYSVSYPRSRYPLATTTDMSGIVRSPYPPHHLVDVRKIPAGARVVDPSVNRVFTRP